MIIIANVKILYEGRDITRDISPFITAFTFTDNSDSKADDISITLQDRESLWLNDWTPSKADKISCTIISDNEQLSCGTFEVDQLDYSIPPHSLTIKATSCAVSRTSRRENHNRSWEDSSLREIASTIAADNGLSLFYDAENIFFDRREQNHMPDLEFLSGLCDSFGLSLKISSDKLIIFSQDDYDSHEAVDTITSDDTKLISAKFSSKSSGTFKKARVKYHDPVKNETYEASYEDPDEEGVAEEIEIFSRVDSQSQAESVAKSSLTKANAKELTASLSLKGSSLYMAGTNITLSGFGMFSGKYFVETVTHSLNPGWSVSLKLSMGGASKKAVKKKKSKSQKSSSQGGFAGYADNSEGYGQ